jgi:nucleoside 2-deoxyribosyltransferase
MKKIYIAGFDVFKKDSIALGKKLVTTCKEYGFEGLYPLDNVVDFNQPKEKIAYDIYEANVAMIKKADIIIANLNPFRGKEPDSGTVWECGYGFALGKEVYGYMADTSPYINKFTNEEFSLEGELSYDTNGMLIEDFNLPLNLMISCSVTKLIEGEFEDVLKVL